MMFHEAEDFKTAILATAEYFGMRPAFVEKDYWVTIALKNLSTSPSKVSTVFKGGTSLSKAYNCIKRFSEDVDLAIITTDGQSQMAVKRQLKAVELAASTGLERLENPPPVKRGKNRFSCYGYPSVFSEEDFIAYKPYIRLEISAFTNPVPYTEKSLRSYLAEFLIWRNESDLIKEHNLESFNIKVLNIERTLCEKLLSLLRISYKGIDSLKEKIRHFYDLTLLLKEDTVIKMINEKNYDMLDAAYQDDKIHTTFYGDWMNTPFIDSPLFEQFDEIWKSLRNQYQRELTELSWSEKIPTNEEIKDAFLILKEFVKEYKN